MNNSITELIGEFEVLKVELEKKINCDGFNGISNPINDEKLNLITYVISRLNEYIKSHQ